MATSGHSLLTFSAQAPDNVRSYFNSDHFYWIAVMRWAIKHCRRVAPRYAKLAASYLAFVQLASIKLWLRVNESTS